MVFSISTFHFRSPLLPACFSHPHITRALVFSILLHNCHGEEVSHTPLHSDPNVSSFTVRFSSHLILFAFTPVVWVVYRTKFWLSWVPWAFWEVLWWLGLFLFIECWPWTRAHDKIDWFLAYSPAPKLPCSPSAPHCHPSRQRLPLSGTTWGLISPILSITEVSVLLARPTNNSNKFRSSSNMKICPGFDCLIYTIRTYLWGFPLRLRP